MKIRPTQCNIDKINIIHFIIEKRECIGSLKKLEFSSRTRRDEDESAIPCLAESQPSLVTKFHQFSGGANATHSNIENKSDIGNALFIGNSRISMVIDHILLSPCRSACFGAMFICVTITDLIQCID